MQKTRKSGPNVYNCKFFLHTYSDTTPRMLRSKSDKRRVYTHERARVVQLYYAGGEIRREGVKNALLAPDNEKIFCRNKKCLYLCRRNKLKKVKNGNTERPLRNRFCKTLG